MNTKYHLCRTTAFLVGFLFTGVILGQGHKPILVYDLVLGTVDIINNINDDVSTLNEKTPHNIGKLSQPIQSLDSGIPATNLFPGSQFTKKKRASKDFDLNRFPISTSVKIFRAFDDSLGNLCSGSMISKKHVITAAHCLSSVNTNHLFNDKMYVAPAFDNGHFNGIFQGSHVSKVYIFENWTFHGEDIAILELDEPIGELTGWLSIGFESRDSILREGIFYKFSYPTVTTPFIDSNEYNGDTLYFNYGKVDNITENSIGINGTTGIGGESGSSIIKVEDDEKYISYGVLSFANNLGHSRINKWRYYAIKSIIENDLNLENHSSDEDYSVYPNPATLSFSLKVPQGIQIIDLIIYDIEGKEYQLHESSTPHLTYDIAGLSQGIYFVQIVTKNRTITKKIIINNEPK